MNLKQLQRLIDRQESRLRRQLQKALDTLVQSLGVKAVERALKQSRPVELERALRNLPRALRPAFGTLADMTAQAAQFTAKDPRAIWAAERQAARLITRVSDTTRKAVRRVIVEALRDGTPPREVARRLQALVGSKWRARMIARTEIHMAAHSGQMAGYRARLASGDLLPGEMLKKWITTDDEQFCPICGSLDQQKRDINDPFVSKFNGKSYDHPPAHPNCRCDFGLVANPAFGRKAA